MSQAELYPLQLSRRLDARIWGGDTLGGWLGLEQAPARLAESWQVYDDNTVLNGALAGQSLADVARQFGADLVGTRSFARYGADFPLLAKFIDAAESLSVQVHPDDSYAHTHEAASGFHGKTEAWYILSARPDADLIYGLMRPVRREELAQAIADNTLPALLKRVPVVAGDTIFVPAGTIHAIEPGIMLFEIQQKSDLTYRIYDYDRRDAQGQPRDLHVAKALEVSDLTGALPPRPLPLKLAGDDRTLLVACPYFALELLRPQANVALTTDGGSFEILTAIAGRATLAWAGGSLDLGRGQSLVLPATPADYRIVEATGLELLRCYVPDVAALRDELRAQGASEQAIADTVHGQARWAQGSENGE